MRTRLRVAGICCPSEVPLIHAILDGRPGVRAVKVIVPTQTVVVEHASTTASVSSIVDTPTRRGSTPLWRPRRKLQENKISHHMVRLYGILRLHFPSWPRASCSRFPLLHSAGGALDQLKWVALGAVVIGLPPILHRAFSESSYWRDRHQHAHDARRGGCLRTSRVRRGGGSCSAFWTIGVFGRSRAIRTATTARWDPCSRSNRSLLADSSASDIEVPIEDVAVGETVLVCPGESVPRMALLWAGALCGERVYADR